MDTTTMTANWLTTRWVSSAQARMDEEARAARMAREHARLAEENARLRQQRDDLLASAELWVRLYESALTRANGARPGAVCH